MTKKYEHIFVIGDVHGCAHELNILIRQLPITPDSLIVFLGDYIDRGEDSKAVVDTVLKLKSNYNVVTLKGNHENMFLDFLADKDTPEAGAFIFNGGGSTLSSYGDEFGDYNIPDNHMEFFNSLDYFFETEHYLFVHAGLPDIEIKELYKNDYREELLWIRDSFLKSKFNWGKLVIHGHTPVPEKEILSNRINIDTGCVFEGKLTALQLPEMIYYDIPKQHELRHFYLRDKNSRRKAIRFSGNMPIYIYEHGNVLEFETIDYSEFQTINYSEFGILMFDPHNSDKQVLEVNQHITGHIGNDKIGISQFEGTVLRCEKKVTGIYYAIKFTKTPFDFMKENE